MKSLIKNCKIKGSQLHPIKNKRSPINTMGSSNSIANTFVASGTILATSEDG